MAAEKCAFTENDIRSRDFAAELKRAILEDREYLHRQRDRFVAVACPACSAEGTKAFDKDGIDYARCPRCATVYVNPRPSENLLKAFYAQSKVYEVWNNHIFPASEDVRRKRIFAPRVDRVLDICERHGIETDSLVEIGAGFGTFCEELRQRRRFQRVIGIEPTPHLAATCRRRGIEVIENTVEDVTLPKACADVVTSFETIEHIYDPAAFLSSARRLLRPNGVLVLSCPNFLGFEVLTLGTKSTTVDHEHLNYFNPRSLPLLLERCGFLVLEVMTPGVLDADIVRNKALDGDIELPPFLHYLLIERWADAGPAFQEFLSTNLLSSHMWICAKNTPGMQPS